MSDPRDADDAPELLPLSKSARKRDAHARQKLGERLLSMRESDLDALQLPEPLPEELREALREGRRIASRGALARQRQYIGRLMRTIDAEALERELQRREEVHAARARLRR